MMKKQTIALALAAVAALATGAALWLATDNAPDKAEAPARVTDRHHDSVPPAPSRARAAATALGGVYTVTYALDMNVMAGSVDGLAGKSALTLRGTLEMGPAPAGGAWLVGRMGALEVSGDDALIARAALHEAAVSEAIGKPFALRFDEDGAVAERRFDASISVGARGIVSTLVAGLQVVRPEDQATATSWTVREPGVDGDVEATYLVAANGRATEKTWSREVGGERTLDEPAHMVSSGRATSRRTSDDALLELRFRATLRGDISLAEGAPLTLQSATNAMLDRVGPGDMGWADALDPMSLTTDEALEARARARTAGRLVDPGDADVHALLAEARDATGRSDAVGRRVAMKKLAAAIRQDGTVLDELGTRLRTPGLAPNELRTMVEAVALADTPEAHAAMHQLMVEDAAPHVARHAMTQAAGLMADPPAAIIDTLTTLSRGALDELGVAALLGLGIQGNPERQGRHTTAIREDLIGRANDLIGTDDTPEPAAAAGPPAAGARVGVWLDALGNLGGDEVWPLIAPYMSHPDEAIRLSAVGALYFVELREAREALVERIVSDPSKYVRREALRTGANHPRHVFESTIIRALREDEAPNVRLEAATALAGWGIDAPAYYGLIEAAAAREGHPTVRQIMTELMPEDLTRPSDLAPPSKVPPAGAGIHGGKP